MVKVSLIFRDGRQFYEARWVDQSTQLKRTRSTGTKNRREAERFAARLEDDLNNPQTAAVVQLSWSEFRKKYEKAVFPAQAVKTRSKTQSTFNAIERHVKPSRVTQLDDDAVIDFADALREKGCEETTIKSHLAELRKVLVWAKKKKHLPVVPDIDMPKNLPGMKGRPITGEEFDRYIDAIPAEIPIGEVESWDWYLRGMWWSSLRLAESLVLHWEDPSNLCIDLSGEFPMFMIQAHAEKGKKFRMLPMAPEFAEIILSVPKRKRRGFVFNPHIPRSIGDRPRPDTVSKIAARIGKKAGIRVWRKGEKEKHATLHDLRRAFGFRWSQRVMPAVLQELMRHADIKTTMQYYVGRNAEVAADQAWSAWRSIQSEMSETKAHSGNTSGNTSGKSD